MKKAFAIVSLLAVLALAGCGQEEIQTVETVPETLAAEASEETQQNPALDAIIQACGMPFKFHCPTNRDVHIVKFYEDHAKRELWTKYDADEEQDGLSWKIEGDQMILSGQWSESFTVDLNTMEASSNENGKVYRILPVDKVED